MSSRIATTRAALDLGVGSAFECGYGGGDHLENLQHLGLHVSGVDISSERRDFVLERHPARVRLLIADFTQPAVLTELARARLLPARVPAYRVECDGDQGIPLDKQAGLDLPVWSDDHAIRAVS